MSNTNPFYPQQPQGQFSPQGQFPAPFGSPQPSRPAWLIPVIVGVTALVVVAALVVWLVASGGDDKDSAAPAQTTVVVITEQPDSSDPDPDSGSASMPTAVQSAPSSDGNSGGSSSGSASSGSSSGSGSIGSGYYGAGLNVQQDCGSTGTSASYVLTGAGTAQCDFARDVGDVLSGTTVREGSSRNITVYSYNRSENVDLSCLKAQDSDRDFLWKCTTEFNSIVYVYP